MSEKIKCFEGNHQPYDKFWTIVNAEDSQSGENEIHFDGFISEYSWFDDDITPGKFKADLSGFGGNPITIRLNSWGGEVIAATMINTMIRDYPGNVTVQIDGVAASAATLIAIAGDHVRMVETGFYMIHDPGVSFFFAFLGLEDLRRYVGMLESVKEGLINGYETKTGLSRSRISNFMSAESWFDARSALNLGFIDEIVKPGQKGRAGTNTENNGGDNAAVLNAAKNYKNVPVDLLRNNPVQNCCAGDQVANSDAQKEREIKALKDYLLIFR